jgi:glycosyltransferase involved in cell wall biosynthesis
MRTIKMTTLTDMRVDSKKDPGTVNARHQSAPPEEPDNFSHISVILPARNEEITIGECITKIQGIFAANKINGEIIVSDSSTDRTAEIASGLGATVVHPKKIGYGNAYFEGISHAKNDIIVMMDSDGTYDPSCIIPMLERIRNGADLVLGSRFKGNIETGAMTPLHRYIGNPFLTWILNIVFGTSFSDAHTGFRVIRRDALEKLQLKTGGMEFASEMLVMACRKNLVIDEIPISYYPRRAPSNLHSFADGWRHLRLILLIKPVPFIAIPVLIFSLIGGVLMTLFYLWGNVEFSHLHSFILGAILLIGGVQVVIAGIETEVYSITHGYQEKTRLMAAFLNYHSLEKFLVLGGLFIIGGTLVGASIFMRWVYANFGEISQISAGVVALSMILIGIQVITCSVFISMMLLSNGDSG